MDWEFVAKSMTNVITLGKAHSNVYRHIHARFSRFLYSQVGENETTGMEKCDEVFKACLKVP